MKQRGLKSQGGEVSSKRTSPKPVQKSSSNTSRFALHPSTTASPLWISLLLIALNLLIYAQVWNYSFVNFDDPDYVYQNPYITAGLTWHGILWALTAQLQSNWHPLTWLSHMTDAQLYGVNAGGHHLTNVFLHVFNSLILFWLLYRMTEALGRSAFVAGIFAVHPLHVESVAWVSERKDVLSTFFALLSVWAYVGYARDRRLGRYLLVLLFFALALMAKPMVVTLPFVLLLLDFWPLRRISMKRGEAEFWRLVYEKIPLFILAVISSIVTFVVQQGGHSMMASELLPLGVRVPNALISYVAYISKVLWPSRLAPFYPYPYSAPGPLSLLLAFGGLLAATAFSVKAAARYPYIPVGWFWFLGTLVPVIGLVQVGSQSMADRYTYVPLIGLAIIVAWGVPELSSRMPGRTSILAVGSSLVILLLVITTTMQVRHWRDSISLWGHALEVTENNYMAHYALGAELGGLGKHQEAAAHLQEALRINREYTPAYYNLGTEFAALGKFDDAGAQFSEAIRRDPIDAGAHNNLANILVAKGQLGEAAEHYRVALRISPDYVDARSNLASVLIKQGDFAAAMREILEVLRIDPMHPNARQMLEDLKRRGISP